MILSVVVLAAVAGPDLQMARKVDWGYGCGGNCAIRNQGESKLTVWLRPRVRIVDEGKHTLTENSPDGGIVQESSWSYEWSGKARATGNALALDLARARDTCTRTEKSKTGETALGCPRAPAKLRVDCERGEVVIEGQAHKVWTCRSPKAPPGTVQPWIFGIDEIIDETIGGEPRPESAYRLRQ